jgi:acetylornithine deacetylase/succinyl-diaminopimelate desuccinylase-like protein
VLQPHFGYRGFEDANLFSANLGIPTIQFGPHGSDFHQANEWVDVTTIAGTARVLVRLALDFLNRSQGIGCLGLLAFASTL